MFSNHGSQSSAARRRVADSLADRPAHKGHPGDVISGRVDPLAATIASHRTGPAAVNPAIPEGCSAGPEGPRIEWSGGYRIDVTASLPESNPADAIEDDLRCHCIGYRRQDCFGAWEGAGEYGATFSFVSDTPSPQGGPLVAFHAALAAGCEAVQVEFHGPQGYRVEEWRQAV